MSWNDVNVINYLNIQLHVVLHLPAFLLESKLTPRFKVKKKQKDNQKPLWFKTATSMFISF